MKHFEYEYTRLSENRLEREEEFREWGSGGFELVSFNFQTLEAVFKRTRDDVPERLARLERLCRIQAMLLSALAENACPNSELLGEAIDEMQALAREEDEED